MALPAATTPATPATPATPTPPATPASYSVSGTVSGLAPDQQVTLLNKGGDALTVYVDGSFRFPTPVAPNGSYAVTVGTQPDTQHCMVTHGRGSNVNAEVSGVGIACLASGLTSTVAGSGVWGSADGTGVAAEFDRPFRTAFDSNGNMYVADNYNHMIRKITPAGVVTTLAGTKTAGKADGLGSAASFYLPTGIAVDRSGNLYVADSGNHLIRRITPEGLVSTWAGTGTSGFADGVGMAASFDLPAALALDGSGNLYVADFGNNRIRKVTPAGVVTTLAGSGAKGRADGTGAAASFNNPQGLALDGNGDLYVADRNNYLIRKLTPAGVVTTLAGSGAPGSGNGAGAAASFALPVDVAVDSSGNIYIADAVNHMIREMTPAGVVSTLAGSTTSGRTDGLGAAASFQNPAGVTIDGDGILYVADYGNNLIRKVVP